jgi:hypothetical protein
MDISSEKKSFVLRFWVVRLVCAERDGNKDKKGAQYVVVLRGKSDYN